MKLKGIFVGSEDPQRIADYYRKLFGEPEVERGGYAQWIIAGSSLVIGPHDQVKGANSTPGRIMWAFESADLKAEAERLRAAGAIVVDGPYEEPNVPGLWIATFADPDDNYFQLVSPM